MKINSLFRRSLLKLASIAPTGFIGLHNPNLFSMAENYSSSLKTGAPNSANIKNVQAYVLPKTIFIKIEPDHGVARWGERSPFGDQRVTAAIAQAYDVPIVAHNTEAFYCTAASVHFTAFLFNADYP